MEGAADNTTTPYILVIDEINRANLTARGVGDQVRRAVAGQDHHFLDDAAGVRLYPDIV